MIGAVQTRCYIYVRTNRKTLTNAVLKMGFTRTLTTVWLAEAVRLHEVKNGRCEDTQETHEAIRQGATLETRLLIRANELAKSLSLATVAKGIAGQARWVLAGLIFFGLLGGVSAAISALGNGQSPVNLLVALLTLLGLHLVTLVLWLVSTRIETAGPPGLGKVWLTITRKLNKQANQQLLLQGLINTLNRAGALKPVLGTISHIVWSAAMVAVVLTLLVLLSARQYQFQWETTLLGAGVFVELTQLLGWLPSLLGFNVPLNDIINSSISTPSSLPNAGVVWSSWLIGCVLVYGVIPRIVLLAVCIQWAKRKIQHTPIDTALPGYVGLRTTLMPHSNVVGIDRPASSVASTTRPAGPKPFNKDAPYAILGLELSDEAHWPPMAVGNLAKDLGRVDSRAQRELVLHSLNTHAPEQIIAMCDASQTPDRGTLNFLRQLASRSAGLYIVAQPSQSGNNRYDIWQEQIAQLPVHSAHLAPNLQALFDTKLSPTHDAR